MLWCYIAAMRCSPCHVDNFEKKQRASHFTFCQAVNTDTTGICCPRFGNSIMIFPDLVKSPMRLAPAHTLQGKFDWVSEINEDWNDGCCLVHAINTADGSSLYDHCFRDYHLHYEDRGHSYRRFTFAISESYREIWRVFPMKRYSSYRVLVFPNFAAVKSVNFLFSFGWLLQFWFFFHFIWSKFCFKSQFYFPLGTFWLIR